MRMRKKKNGDARIAACSELLIENTAHLAEDPQYAFSEKRPLYIEIGCGKGNFACGTAAANHDRNLIAMERVADILAAVPFIVVATLFQLHLAQRAGPVLSLLFAFVATGWIGIASRVRTQFYRYKHAEYVLAARTLGASDRRLIFRHILPNAMGTIITRTILIIPGGIISESIHS